MPAKRIIPILCLLICAGCGSSFDEPDDDGGNSSPSVSEAGAPVLFTYFFETQLDSDDNLFDFAFPYPDSYSVPLYIREDGTVTLFARDFPAMVLRACDTEGDDCNVVSGDLDFGKIDLVLDSCGRDLEDRDCGEDDDSAFTGMLSSDGSLIISGIYIRARIFAVTGSSSGFAVANSTSTCRNRQAVGLWLQRLYLLEAALSNPILERIFNVERLRRLI